MPDHTATINRQVTNSATERGDRRALKKWLGSVVMIHEHARRSPLDASEPERTAIVTVFSLFFCFPSHHIRNTLWNPTKKKCQVTTRSLTDFFWSPTFQSTCRCHLFFRWLKLRFVAQLCLNAPHYACSNKQMFA